MSKLYVSQLSKAFGKTPKKALIQIQQGLDKESIFKNSGNNIAVHNVNFSVNEGEIFVIMGLSGSGKSTLVRLLNRLIEPTEGTIVVDGKNIGTLSSKKLLEFRRQKMSMVFQSFALMPHLNVIDNVSFGLELAGVSKKKRYEKAEAILQQMELSTHINSFPDALSGGMQQRVGLARALVCNTDIILMDEAFSALDPIIRGNMQDEILKIQAQFKKTIVFVSHDVREAVKICSRMAVMHEGNIVQVGTPIEILEHPANDYVANFFKNLTISEVIKLRENHPNLETYELI